MLSNHLPKPNVFVSNNYVIADFSYGPNAESEWGNAYPECNGTMQSPIPLSAMTARPGLEAQPLELTNYQLDPTQVTVINDGKLGKVYCNFLENFPFYGRTKRHRSCQNSYSNRIIIRGYSMTSLIPWMLCRGLSSLIKALCVTHVLESHQFCSMK